MRGDRMEQFSIKFRDASEIVEREKNLIAELEKVADSIGDVSRALMFSTSVNSGIKNNLKSCKQKVEDEAELLRQLKECLTDSISRYKVTEWRIEIGATIGEITEIGIKNPDIIKEIVERESRSYGVTIGGKTYSVDITNGDLKFGYVHGDTTATFNPRPFGRYEFEVESGSPVGGATTAGSVIFGYKKFSSSLSKGTVGSTTLFKDELKHKYGEYTNKTKEELEKEKKDEKPFSDLKDIKENTKYTIASVGYQSSALHMESEDGKATFDIGKGELNGSLYAGYGYVGASLGAAYSVLSITAGDQIGNDMLGAHYNVGIDVGKVSGGINGKLGFLDENGNIDPNVSIELNAEAVALEVTAEGGVSVLGTDVDVEAGVTVGIGAHVDIGYDDGKIKIDAGGALGIGVSVDLEIDISGTVDMIGGAVGKAANAISDLGEAAGEFLGDLFKW